MGLNALVVIVLLIIVFCGFNGLRKGVLGIVYGLVAWIFVFAFVTFSHPYINTYLHENTGVYSYLTEKTRDYLNQEIAKITSVDMAQAAKAVDLEEMDMAQIPPELVEQMKKTFGNMMEQFPSDATEDIKWDALTSAEDLYNSIVSGITEFLMKGISVAIAFVIALVIAGIVGILVASVADLPGLQGINLLFGLIVGAFQGLLYVWLLMYVTLVLSPTSFGQTLLAMIQENAFLTYLYRHNLVFAILHNF